MSTTIKVGVIGYGYWGPNLVRNFANTQGVQVVAVSDLDPARLEASRRLHPGISTTSDFRDLLHDGQVDALAVATPVQTHFSLTLAALQAGKHAFVEKPLAETSEQARLLIEEADRQGVVLMVDHTFIYTPAVQKIRDLIAKGELGNIHYYDSIRVNLGIFQDDVNVIWDLAVHDLSIVQYVLDEKPVAVSAVGTSHVWGSPENIAHMTLFFEGSCVAHIGVNWLAPVKIRQTLIGGSRKMLVYDDLQPSEKIKVYDKGIIRSQSAEAVQQLRIGYRAGDMWAPHLSAKEALQTAAEHFVECIRSKTRSISDGVMGLRVIEMLEAATRSMSLKGRPIELPAQAVERAS